LTQTTFCTCIQTAWYMNKHLAMGLSLLPVILLAVGMISWVLTLRADLDTVIDAWESEDIEVVINSMDAELTQKIDDIRETLAELESIQAVHQNEMMTIMSEHEYMGELLTELGEKQPPGERRAYGNY